MLYIYKLVTLIPLQVQSPIDIQHFLPHSNSAFIYTFTSELSVVSLLVSVFRDTAFLTSPY